MAPGCGRDGGDGGGRWGSGPGCVCGGGGGQGSRTDLERAQVHSAAHALRQVARRALPANDVHESHGCAGRQPPHLRHQQPQPRSRTHKMVNSFLLIIVSENAVSGSSRRRRWGSVGQTRSLKRPPNTISRGRAQGITPRLPPIFTSPPPSQRRAPPHPPPRPPAHPTPAPLSLGRLHLFCPAADRWGQRGSCSRRWRRRVCPRRL
eukprot:COSAG04_NODE_257_length_18753_cov_7.516857_11_plen_206_part_00